MKSYKFQLKLKELEYFSSLVVNFVKNDLVIGLIGELGSGKTTFVKSLVRKLGIDEQVSSPTYSIENEYTNRNSKIFVRHVDLFRGLSDLEQLQLFERKCDQGIEILIIEWSNLLSFPISGEHLVVEFKVPLDNIEDIRVLEISGNPSFFASLKQEIQRKIG